MKSFSVFLNESVSISIKSRLSAFLALGLLLFLAPSLLRAQGLSGITGTVTDPSGAVVPDAKVTATNDATGVSSQTTTTSAGTYTLTDLIPGTYTVRIEKAGFAARLLKGVHVDVSRSTAADADLTTGTASETVEFVAQ
jgi:hypothetical protein